MSLFRCIWAPVLVASGWLQAGAIGQQATPAPAKNELPKKIPAKADSKATEILQEAVRDLDPKKHPWIETTVWQQVDLQGLAFQAEGKYLVDQKEHRMHLELKVYLGDTSGNLLVVSDGKWLWERMQIGKAAKPEVYKTELKSILDALGGPAMAEQARTDYFQRQSFHGLAPLLSNIYQQMTMTRAESIRWKGRDVVKLTGRWSDEMTKKLVAKEPWPMMLPRQCCLYLDTGDPIKSWPHRIEWWGPVPYRSDDALLMQLEFGGPRLAAPSAEQIGRDFSFDPGSAKVVDRTKEETDKVKAAYSRIGMPPRAR
jgi:hypothetical protein